jgi:hypothetical protein
MGPGLTEAVFDGESDVVSFAWISLLFGCHHAPPPEDIISGDYQFYTLAAADACLDGALEALFMPEGPDTEHPFEFPIHVPSVAETPTSYDVDLREPFVGMPVTVNATDTGLAVRGSVMDAVQLDPGQYGDCVATMSVDVDLEPYAKGVLTGEARIDVSNPRGDEGRCPVLDADPCRVTLTLRAELL